MTRSVRERIAHSYWLALTSLLMMAADVATAQEDSPFVIITSATDYMWQEIGGVDRIDIVKVELAMFVEQAPLDRPIGLVQYSGPVRTCSTAETLVPAAMNNSAEMVGAISGLTPSGSPGITDAITRTADELQDSALTATIVLIAYHPELCEGNPAIAAAEMASRNRSFVLHVITLGADLSIYDAENPNLFPDVAEATGGTYANVADGPALQAELQRIASLPPPEPKMGAMLPGMRLRPGTLQPDWEAKPCDCVPGFQFQSYGFFVDEGLSGGDIPAGSDESDDTDSDSGGSDPDQVDNGDAASGESDPDESGAEEDQPESDEPVIQAINFGSYSRIGFTPLRPSPDGSLLVGRAEREAFVALPHRYQSNVDLVIQIDRWRSREGPESPSAVIYDDPGVQRNLSNDIRWLVENYNFDGVTLRLHPPLSGFTSEPSGEAGGTSAADQTRFTPAEFREWRLKLVERIKYRLPEDSEVNVVVDFSELNGDWADSDEVADCRVGQAADRETVRAGWDVLAELLPFAELILVDAHDNRGGAAGLSCPQIEYLRSQMTGYVENDNPIVPIVSPDIELDEEQRRRFFNPASNFGGMGINDIGSGGGFVDFVETTYVMSDEALQTFSPEGDIDFPKRLQLILFPNFCKFVCPNRDIVRTVILAALIAVALAIAASLYFFQLRKFVFNRIFMGITIALLAGPPAYVLCVPEFRDDVNFVLGALLILGLGYLARRRRREEEIERVRY